MSKTTDLLLGISAISGVILLIALVIAVVNVWTAQDQVKAKNLNDAIQMVGKSANCGQYNPHPELAQDVSGQWYLVCGD